jgi:enamine deaminase RidA (YjgF/YER057c/UK114 family)
MKPPLSPFRVHGSTLLSSGFTAIADDGSLAPDFATQVQTVLRTVADGLQGHGLTVADVRSVSAYLADMGDFEAMNVAYREFFAEPYPVRTTIQCGLFPGVLFELSLVAELPA